MGGTGGEVELGVGGRLCLLGRRDLRAAEVPGESERASFWATIRPEAREEGAGTGIVDSAKREWREGGENVFAKLR